MNILHKRWTSKCQPSVYRLKKMKNIPIANAKIIQVHIKDSNANLFLISNYTDDTCTLDNN